MDITQLHYFKAIEEERNFTRAARRVGVTQPALSHQIRNLEHELGGPVFERHGRKVTLTPLGEVLLPHARALIAQLEQAKGETLAHVNAQTGALRVGTTQSFNAVHLRRLICEFLELYPKTTFTVEELLVPEMEERVLNGTLDLGFSYFPARHPGIEEQILYNEALVAAAPPGLFDRDNVTFTEMCDHPMALPTTNTQTRRIIDEHARQAGRVLKPVIESNNIRTNIEVARDLGLVTIASQHLCELVDGVEIIPTSREMPMRQTTMIARKGAHRTKLLDAFCSKVDQQIKALPLPGSAATSPRNRKGGA